MDLFYWVTTLGKAALILALLLQIAPIMVWVERRGSALMQNRLGPNRIGSARTFSVFGRRHQDDL